jgi:hypothetical protein
MVMRSYFRAITVPATSQQPGIISLTVSTIFVQIKVSTELTGRMIQYGQLDNTIASSVG